MKVRWTTRLAALLVLLWAGVAQADVTLFGTGKDPTSSNSANVGPTVDITPPGSMSSGDFMTVLVCYRGTSVTISTSEACGETWSSSSELEASSQTCQVFYSTFDGSWADEGCDGSPQWTVTTGTNGMIAYMLVWSGAHATPFDVSPTSDSYTAPGNPYTVTHPGMTTANDGAVAVYIWNSADNNVWTLQSGGPTLTQPETEWRVTSTTGLSISVGYMTQAAYGATGSKDSQQTSLGGDAGQRWWFAIRPASYSTKRNRIVGN